MALFSDYRSLGRALTTSLSLAFLLLVTACEIPSSEGPAVTPSPTPSETTADTTPSPEAPTPTATPQAPTPAPEATSQPLGFMQPAPEATTSLPASAPIPQSAPEQEAIHYSSCKEARAAGVAPLHEGDPGYSTKLDRDRDGIACE